MPRLSVYFIRTALVYLVAGFSIGALILAQKGSAVIPFAWRLLPAHIEIMFFGWTMQLIIGTAFWILPRHARMEKRGREALLFSSYFSLNSGIWLAMLSSFLPNAAWLLLTGRLAEGLGLAAFILNSWVRIRPFAAQ